MSSLRRFIREIHRRSLWQVLGIYVVASWVVLQVVETLGGLVALPEWFGGLAIGLLVLGLPIVLATAFVQEGADKSTSGAPPSSSSEGDIDLLEAENDSDGGTAHRLFTWRNAMLSGVAGLALWGMVAAGWLVLGAGSAMTGDERPASASVPGDATEIERSVAVLPFDNLSADPEQQYFSDGVADQILNALTRIPDLKVTARTSAFAFRDTDLDIRTIADTLGVATVLEGTVQRSGERVRITAQLIEAESGFHLWSETYDRELTDIFEVQDDVARRIAERLRVELGGVEGERLAGQATESAEAHDHYLRGRQLLYQRTPDGIRGAVEAFHVAVDADPEYAPAYTGLAEAYALGVPFGAAPQGAAYRWAGRAIAYGNRAVELDRMSGDAYAARAYASMIQPASLLAPTGPEERIETDYLRALDLQPSSADALGWYAQLLSNQGRHEEALEMQERSIELDPVSPGRRMGYAASALPAGQHELALEHLRRARVIQPGLGGIVTLFEMWNLARLGRAEECLALERTLATHEAVCLYEVGRVREARVRIDSLVAAWTPADSWLVADGALRYFVWTGNVDRALVWLERGLNATPYFPSAYMGADLWRLLRDEDRERVRSEAERIGTESWERILEEVRMTEVR